MQPLRQQAKCRFDGCHYIVVYFTLYLEKQVTSIMENSLNLYAAAIAKVKARLNIIAVVSQYVKLSKKDNGLVGKCPILHNSHGEN